MKQWIPAILITLLIGSLCVIAGFKRGKELSKIEINSIKMEK